MHKLQPDTVPVNWFDLMVIITLLLGLRAGRKRGMSEELILTTQWLAMIFAGAFLYKPVGDLLAQTSPMSHLFCYIAIYITAAIITKIFFSLVKKALGGKLVGSDLFGNAEYYLGMLAGAVRYCCMLIAAMALLNAPFYSSQEIGAARAYQNDVFGSNFFPELSTIQSSVFRESFVGSVVKKRAGILLIASTKSESVNLQRRKDDLP
jgi:uncharacterized membrane protein required for colicin V production